MLKSLTIATIAGLAFASCPNQCSGHGYCDENDRCLCYRAPGTKGLLREAYTGSDCSQKVCPYGRSFDVISDATHDFLPVNFDSGKKHVSLYRKGHTSSQPKLEAFLNNGFLLKRDLGLDIQIVDVSADTVKFSWKTNTEKTFNKEETAKVGAAYTTKEKAYHVKPTINKAATDSGLYLYFPISNADTVPATQTLYKGDFYSLNVTFNNDIKFAADDHNNAHGNIECSGRGTCDRALGVCKCVEGYTGDACQRTECPNDCSGHGTCQSQHYFTKEAYAGDANAKANNWKYDAFDAQGQMGCKCDAGFRGADCSQIECPSGEDPLKGDGGAQGRDCSGRGTCDYTTGLCQCYKGYFGERCESITNLV